MKQFLLLRDNKQTGPYSIDEIKTLELISTDLIWIEGSSSFWMHPQEMQDFSNFSITEKKIPTTFRTTTTSSAEDLKLSRVFVSLPQSKKTNLNQADLNIGELDKQNLESEIKFSNPLKDVKEMFAENKRNTWRNSSFNFTTIAVPVGMFAVLIFSAFLIKQIIETFDDDYVKTTETTSVAIPLQEEESEEAGADFQNALSTEIAIPHTDTVQTIPKKKKVENLKSLVSVKGGDYKKRVLGGIEGLELTITNKSPHELDKVEVELNYLKQNGDVIKTETYEINSVPAKGTKTFQVPPSNRGVKVKYKINNIISKQHKSTLVQA